MCLVAVVVPLYKVHPSAQEVSAINHNFAILKDYPKYIIAPLGLNLNEYEEISNNCEILYLATYWFKSLNSYNQLLLTKMFYNLFVKYEFILILQPDALVFKDELKEWCAKGFSYIGAPWPQSKLVSPYSFHGWGVFRKLLPFINKPIKCDVGNGGLSLRKVKDCISILKKHYLPALIWGSQEDYFWAYYFLTEKGYSIPSELDASKFSLEQNAEQYYINNGSILPFGCHAYDKYDFKFLEGFCDKR